MNQYHKLYTPGDSVVVFIDHQPQMTFGVAPQSAQQPQVVPAKDGSKQSH